MVKMGPKENSRASQGPQEPGPIPLLSATAPAPLQPLLAQTLQALAEDIERAGARVFIIGIARTPSGETRTWYELFSEQAVEKLFTPEVIRALQAFASPERLKLLLALSQGRTSFAELVEACSLTQGQFYHHLRFLETTGLIRKKRRDEYEITLYGTSALFTFLATADYILRVLAPESAQQGSKEP